MNDIHVRVVCQKCKAPIEAWADNIKVLKGSFDTIAKEMDDHIKSGCKYPVFD